MRSAVWKLLGCLAGVMSIFSGVAFGDAPDSLTVSPDILHVDTFFSGGKISIEGDIPEGNDVFIEILGPRSNEIFNIKGKMALFWMTRENVHINDAPRLYMLLLPMGSKWSNEAAGLGLGVDQLENQIQINGSEMSKDDIFKLFVHLKDSEKLYGELPEAISYSSGANNRRHFSAEYRFPASTTTGVFTVRATTISNGTVSAKSSHDVTVEEVGFVKLVNELASNQRIIYGVAAVLIALFAGAVMGFIFKGGGGH